MAELSLRLQAIEKHIGRGCRVADIGTDHAYLPIHIIESGLCEKVIACDIKSGPLKTAEKNIQAAGVSGVELRLCDGLSGIHENEIDTAVIAGMGGEIIRDIIESAAFIKDEGTKLILQPMTSAEDLREYLSCFGFEILSEEAVEDAGRIYPVIVTRYSGNNGCYRPFEYYIGHMRGANEAEQKYILKHYRRLKKLWSDLENVSVKSDKRTALGRDLEKINAVVKEF